MYSVDWVGWKPAHPEPRQEPVPSRSSLYNPTARLSSTAFEGTFPVFYLSGVWG